MPGCGQRAAGGHSRCVQSGQGSRGRWRKQLAEQPGQGGQYGLECGALPQRARRPKPGLGWGINQALDQDPGWGIVQAPGQGPGWGIVLAGGRGPGWVLR